MHSGASIPATVEESASMQRLALGSIRNAFLHLYSFFIQRDSELELFLSPLRASLPPIVSPESAATVRELVHSSDLNTRVGLESTEEGMLSVFKQGLTSLALDVQYSVASGLIPSLAHILITPLTQLTPTAQMACYEEAILALWCISLVPVGVAALLTPLVILAEEEEKEGGGEGVPPNNSSVAHLLSLIASFEGTPLFMQSKISGGSGSKENNRVDLSPPLKTVAKRVRKCTLKVLHKIRSFVLRATLSKTPTGGPVAPLLSCGGLEERERDPSTVFTPALCAAMQGYNAGVEARMAGLRGGGGKAKSVTAEDDDANPDNYSPLFGRVQLKPVFVESLLLRFTESGDDE